MIIKPIDNLNTALFELKDPKDNCETLEYSPDEKYLAVGCYDKNVYIYKCEEEKYVLHKTLDKHSGGVFALDWDDGSKYLRANCTEEEISYWDVDDAKKVEDLKIVRDLGWASHNCKLTWETKPIFPYGYKFDYINCCCIDNDGLQIATGDDDAYIRIHPVSSLKAHAAEMSVECAKFLEQQNPPVKVDKEYIHKYRAHAGYIGRVAFDHEAKYMFSLGGNDKALIQWKTVRD